jgi:hypothetical protein
LTGKRLLVKSRIVWLDIQNLLFQTQKWLSTSKEALSNFLSGTLMQPLLPLAKMKAPLL